MGDLSYVHHISGLTLTSTAIVHKDAVVPIPFGNRKSAEVSWGSSFH